MKKNAKSLYCFLLVQSIDGLDTRTKAAASHLVNPYSLKIMHFLLEISAILSSKWRKTSKSRSSISSGGEKSRGDQSLLEKQYSTYFPDAFKFLHASGRNCYPRFIAALSNKESLQQRFRRMPVITPGLNFRPFSLSDSNNNYFRYSGSHFTEAGKIQRGAARTYFSGVSMPVLSKSALKKRETTANDINVTFSLGL